MAIEAAERQEAAAPYGAAAGPKGAGRAGMAGVGVVVEQVAELTRQPRGGGAVVVAAEHRIELGVALEVPADALEGVMVKLHIGIDEHEDVTRGAGASQVAGHRRPGVVAGGQQVRSRLLQPGRCLGRHAIEHH